MCSGCSPPCSFLPRALPVAESELVLCSYLEEWSSAEDSALVGGLAPGASALERVCSLLESSATDTSDGHLRATVRFLTANKPSQA